MMLAVGLAVAVASPAAAQLYINEIFWDAGGAGSDERDEYVELRGTPNLPLADHYLLFIENEDSHDFLQTGDAGKIEGFFDLNNFSMGSNGFLMLRQKGNLYDSLYGGVAAGTTDLVNAGTGLDSDAWGNNAKTPGSSTVGFSWEPNPNDARNVIENSGFTAMLINKGSGPTPTVGMLLDGNVNNDSAELVEGVDPTPHDGLDYPGEGQPGWSILDSIGIHSEGLEAVWGRTYAQINFGTIEEGVFLGGDKYFAPNIEPGAVYVHAPWTDEDVPAGNREREIEYIARWGNSTGQTEADWHVSNVTDRTVAGSSGAPDYRVSGDPHPACFGCALAPDFVLQSNQDVPYGTPMMDTLGDPNLGPVVSALLGDYNGNDTIDAADYTAWRDAMTAGATSLPNDATPGTVDESDFTYWRAHFGETLGSGAGAGASAAAVPEPASIALLLLAAPALALRRRKA
jgi:hypothetical protein